MRTLSTITVLLLSCSLIAGCPNGTTAGGSSTGTTSGGATGTTAGGTTGTTTGGGTTAGGTAGATDADRILELVNQERTSRGLSALTRNTQLDAAADGHAADMHDKSFFAHTGSDGSSVGDRATAAGFMWTRIGENIGEGDVTAEKMMELWMNSDGHRANILDADFTLLGVGTDERGTKLWVQVFGTP